MNKSVPVPVNGNSKPEKIKIRRRNTQGASTVAISITVPIELNKTLERIMAKKNEAKSFVATQLMEKALSKARKG